MNTGFFFCRIEVRGDGKAPASVDFEPGLNVVSGASETGKSYILQCLDFVLGAGDAPEAIDESKGYDKILVGMRTWEGTEYSLERSISGGDILLYEYPVRMVDSSRGSELLKHKKRTKKHRSISDFLLSICRLDGKELLANKSKMAKQILKFRAVAHLSVIDEERIDSRSSPIYGSSIPMQQTMEESCFRYLISGTDDSSLVCEPAQDRDRRLDHVRDDVVQSLIGSMESDLRCLSDNPELINSQLERLDDSIDHSTAAVQLEDERIREMQVERRGKWKSCEKVSSRLEVLKRLVDRLTLLDDYYQSDLLRLGTIHEAGMYMGRMPAKDCPICGVGKLSQDEFDLDLVESACLREISRTTSLRKDLKCTVKDIEVEILELDSKAGNLSSEIKLIGDQIESNLAPAQRARKVEIDGLLASRMKLERASELVRQIERLRGQLIESDRSPVGCSEGKPEVDELPVLKSSLTANFCSLVETVLSEWNFPDSGRVSFSERRADLVIGGKDRSSYGRGMRALSHAAFSVALLRLCRSEGRPCTGFVVLDSPLVAYREPDSKRAVEKGHVKEQFYKALAECKLPIQVIVFENEDPPSSLLERINSIHFSGDVGGDSRCGFFSL